MLSIAVLGNTKAAGMVPKRDIATTLSNVHSLVKSSPSWQLVSSVNIVGLTENCLIV